MTLSAEMRYELLHTHFCGSGLGCWHDSHRQRPQSGHIIEGRVAHSGGGSLIKLAAGCFVTGMGGSSRRAGRGGAGGGGATGLKGVSTYSFAERSFSGRGRVSVTGGAGLDGGVVVGEDKFMALIGRWWMRARDEGGSRAVGGDGPPPWLAMWSLTFV